MVVPDLPPEMAIHFATSGEPDDYVPQSMAVISVPLVALATTALVRGAARLDPPDDPRSMDIVVVGTTALLAGVHLFVPGWNLSRTGFRWW